MNCCIFTGRLGKDPVETQTKGEKPVTAAHFSIAVSKRYKKEGETDANFIHCIAYGKTAEFILKFFKKGMKIEIRARVDTGSYVSRSGQKVYYTDFIVEDADFAEKKTEEKES